jgi:hypothetical protein
MKSILLAGLAIVSMTSSAVMAGDQTTPAPSAVDPSIAAPTTDTRFGLCEGLDSRSSYGQGVFPEPFLVDDSDLESNEMRLDWLHTAGEGNQHGDAVAAEFEKGFGQLTLEVKAPIERDSSSGQISTNFGKIEAGARYPFYEYVTPKGEFDSTFGAAIEVGVPVGSVIARNTEVVPKIFNDLKVGEHFTLQSILGYSTLIGNSGDDGRVQALEYGFVFGYTIPHEEQFTPVFELSGERQMNKGDHGNNSLLANAGFRANLKAVGPFQPRLGIGYVFPVDYGAHQDVHWGVATSLVFEY